MCVWLCNYLASWGLLENDLCQLKFSPSSKYKHVCVSVWEPDMLMTVITRASSIVCRVFTHLGCPLCFCNMTHSLDSNSHCLTSRNADKHQYVKHVNDRAELEDTCRVYVQACQNNTHICPFSSRLDCWLLNYFNNLLCALFPLQTSQDMTPFMVVLL